MKKKVTFLHLNFGRYGGAEIYTLQSARALQSLGICINAISSHRPHSKDTVEGIPHVGLMPVGRWMRRLYRKFLWPFFLKDTMRHQAYDANVVVVGHVNLIKPVVAFCRQQGIPVWLIVYGIDIWREWSVKEAQSIEACERIIAISQYTAVSVKRRLNDGSERVRILHPMVDIDTYCIADDAPPSEPLVILTVGRLAANEAYKGHDLIIRALPEVIRRLGIPVEYWIVGDGDDLLRLQKIVQDANMNQQVRFLGRLEGDEFLETYHRCHVFAMPSYVTQKSSGQWTGEGFGIVYAEAAACGKPVLACDVGGQIDVVRHKETGLLVQPTVEAVEDGLFRILNDLERARQMGSAGREFVLNNFTKEHFYKKWAELAQSIS